jgi:hypothetical protein
MQHLVNSSDPHQPAVTIACVGGNLRLLALRNELAVFVQRTTRWLQPGRAVSIDETAIGKAAPGRRKRRSLAGDRRCAVTLELAIIAVPFLVVVLGVMELSFDLFVQAALDNATATAARSVQTGAQTATGETSAAFVKNSVCPSLNRLLDCALLTVAVAPLSTGKNYYNAPALTYAQASSTGGNICTGTSGQPMQIGAWYAAPTFVGLLVPSFTTYLNGQYVHVSHSSAGFVNEYWTNSSGISTCGGTGS